MEQHTLCTCTIELDSPEDWQSVHIEYCPLHKGAPEMLEAAKEFIKADASVVCTRRSPKSERDHYYDLKIMALAKLEAIIAKATQS